MKRMRKTALALVLTLVFQMSGGLFPAWGLMPSELPGETAIHTGQAEASDPSQSTGEPEDSIPPGETGDSNDATPPVNPDDTKPPAEAGNPDSQLPPSGSGDSNDATPPVNPDDTKPPAEAGNPDSQLPPSGSGDSNDVTPPVNPDDTKPPAEVGNPDGQLPSEQAVIPENRIAPLQEPVTLETGQIHSAEELKAMSNGVYKLTADIDLTGQNWISMDFSGTLDGGGHTVTLDGTPLFGSLSGTVTNLVLTGKVYITENVNAGPMALTETETGQIGNCVSAVNITAADNVWKDMSGFVGELNGGSIRTCVVTGDFPPASYAAAAKAGSGTVQNCYWSSDRIVGAVGFYGITAGECGKKRKADMQSIGFLHLLNQNKQEGGLSWGLSEKDGFPVPGGKFPGKEVDKEALEKAIGEVADIKNSSKTPYTSDSWKRFDQARTAGQELLKDSTAAQSQVNEAVQKLADAKKALTFLNLEALKQAVSDGEKKKNTGEDGRDLYTPESWRAFQDTLEAARSVLDGIEQGQGVTQKQADSKTTVLQRAMEGLRKDLFHQVNREALTAAIEMANKAVSSNSLYTGVTMSAFQSALNHANEINADRGADQSSVDQAGQGLQKATEGLKERSPAMAAIPKDAIHITRPEQLLHLEDGKCYVLDKDMSLSVSGFGGRKWDGAAMNCVLDGQGHTLTLIHGEKNNDELFSVSSKSVFTSIGSDGVVQNLGVVGKTVGEGSIAGECQGLIANCWARMDSGPVFGFGGLTGKLCSGGMILNSYAVAKAGVAQNAACVGLTDSADSNSLIQNCCWPEEASVVKSGTPRLADSSGKSTGEFTRDGGVVKLLNSHRGEQGREWHRDEKGYPYFGAEKGYQPPQALDITLTLKNGTTKPFSSQDGLTLSVFDATVNDRGQAEFGMLFCESHQNHVRWKDVSGAASSDFHPVSVSGDGTLSLQDGAGKTQIALFDENGNELTRFSLTINMEGTVTDTRLILSESPDNGAHYEKLEEKKGTHTVDGRALLKAQVQVKLEGNADYQTVYPGLFTCESSDSKVLRPSYSYFWNTGNPGNADLTVTAKAPLAGKISRQTANITSVYVPLTSVSLDVEGHQELHARTAPTTEAPGTFVPIPLSNPTFTPGNASYQDDWVITSSDPSVASYLTTMVYGFVAKKEGTATFTVTVKDPEGQTIVKPGGSPVTGSKSVTFTYRNPVSSVTMKDGQKEFTVSVGDTLELPLVWKGVNDSPQNPCHVTEADMTWKVEGTGNVQINRAAESVGSDCPGEKWVSNPVWQVIGTGQGDVTVTGTPVDQTQKAKSVTFTVHVTAGGSQKPVDHNQLVQKGMAGAQSFLARKTTSYEFGKEWEVFSLMRSGGSIPTAEVEKYLNSVEQTYKSGGADQKAGGDNQKPTTIARTALALGALNQDASNFRGIDFIHMLCSSDRITDGSNEPIWALIALDTRNFNVPPGDSWDRDKLIAEILRYQNAENGGFGLTDNKTTGVDMTAMALQGLAPWKQRPDVGSAVSKALDYLRKAQNVDGGFGNLESGAQVLTALCALKIDPLDSKNGFVQPTGDLITNIMSYYDETSGGFSHTRGSAAEPMSSVQGLYSLEAYQRFQKGENRLYDLTDADPRAVLIKRLAEAEKLVEKDYTPETWAVFIQAKADAQKVLNRPEATAKELEMAGGQLADAIAGLKQAAGQEGALPQQPTDQIRVSFRLIGADLASREVDLGKGTPNAPYRTWIKTGSYSIPSSSTVYNLFTQALNGAGLRSAGADSNYVRTIYAPVGYGGYALSEFTNGKYSGWMYTVNGKHPDVGLQYYKLKDGDQVIWHYVNDYRYEVEDWRGGSAGNASTWNGWLSVPDTDPPAKPVIPVIPTTSGSGVTVTLTPQVSMVVDGESRVQLTGEDVAKAVEQAKKNNASSIVIEPEVSGEPSKITVVLPGSSIRAIADQTTAGLTIKTEGVHIALPNRALDGLTLKKGSQVSISAETLKEKNGQANGKISVAIQVDGKPLEKLSGGILVTVLAKRPSPAAVMIEVTDQGNQVIRKSAADDKGLTALLDGSATLKIKENNKSFSDVSADYWGRDAVSFAVSHQLFYGTDQDTFDPSGNMTRSMLAAVLWRLDGEEAPKGSGEFQDVNGGWYADAVQWAFENHMVQGDGKNFRPDSPITRQELASILYRYMKREGRVEQTEGIQNGQNRDAGSQDRAKPENSKQQSEAGKEGKGLSRFSDRDQLAPWAEDAMQWAVDAGLISGKDGGRLDPDGEASRAEVAAVMQRSVSYLLK